MAQQPIGGQGLLIVEASRSHSDTPHSVGLLLTRDIHAPGGIRSHSPSKRAAADPQLDRAAIGIGAVEGDANMNNSRERKRI